MNSDEEYMIMEADNDQYNNNQLYDDIDVISNQIRELWDNIMVPYLENYPERQILSRLTINDYDKFFNLMMNN